MSPITTYEGTEIYYKDWRQGWRVNLKSSRCSGLIRFGGIARACLVGAGYPPSLERERRAGRVQFSSVSPFTRPNSAVLFVTSLSPRQRACAAMKRSIEAENSGHIHMLRHETGNVAETIVTFLVPAGAPIRTDLADPGNCSF